MALAATQLYKELGPRTVKFAVDLSKDENG